jgi:hypothetical protein
MRFGAAYASHDDASKALTTHADGLRERLRHVRSREQMVLRITGASAARPTVASGTDYLRTRARPPEIAPLLDALQPFVQDTIVERGQARHVIATVYHLIARSTSASYRNAVWASAAQLPQLSVRVAGPMACYAFT